MKILYLIKYLAIACAPLCACAGEFSDSSKYALNPKGVELSNTQDAPYVTVKEETEEGEEDSFLPIFGKEARERGYELPNPYGIGVNYMHIRQDIDVKSITFGGLSLKINNIFRPNNPTIIDIPSDLFKIDVHSTKQRSHTETIRADAWLFPFMNVYAVAGRTKGKSVSKIDVGSTNPFVNNIIKGIGDMDGLDFILKFKGTTYGLGTTFAGGVGNWFGLLDLNYTKTDLNIIKGDIKDLDTCMKACEGVDYVLNQAAWGSVPRSIEMPIFYAQNNIVGTLNMMEAARQNGVKKFVYASSSSVYGDHPGLPKKEGIEGHVLSPYALTKKTDEEFGRLYKTLYGLDTYGMRYFNVFGRRQNPEGMYAAVIPKFLKLLLKDEAPTINGDGRQSRDFTYIDNVIEANLKACLAPSEAAGEAFNIGSGGRVYLIDLYYELCEALGKKIEPVFGPARKGDIRDSNADISKARELLGYDPDYDFEKGIRLAIDWYKENL